MSDAYLIGMIAVAAAATYATRIAPFLFFGGKEPPEWVRTLESRMPVMIMVILVFYALRQVPFGDYPYGAPEIIGIAVTAAIHWRYRNALLSIVVATALYMVLIRSVFV